MRSTAKTEDFDYAPFAHEVGLGRFHQLFSNELNTIIEELLARAYAEPARASCAGWGK